MAPVTSDITCGWFFRNMLGRVRRLPEYLRAYDLVVLVSLLWFMVQFLRFVFPPLFETFQAIYGISNTETGILFTLMMLAYSVVQFPAGVIGDRFGRPLVIAGGASVFTGAAILAAVSTSFGMLLVAAILIGLATGPHKAVAIPLLSSRYEDRTGRVLGAMDTIGQFGGVVAPLAVVVVLSVFLWRGVFVAAAIVSAALVYLFYRRVNADPVLNPTRSIDEPETDSDEDVSYVSVFRDRDLLAFMIVTMLFTFSWNGLSAFFPLFLTTEKGLSSGFSGLLYSLLFVCSLSQAITGDLSDRVGRLEIGTVLFLTMVVGVGGLIFVEVTPVLIAFTVVIGVGFHGFRPVRDSHLMDIIPDQIGGGTLGVIRTFMTGVGALAPATIGYLSDTVGFALAFGLIAVASALAGLVTLALR